MFRNISRFRNNSRQNFDVKSIAFAIWMFFLFVRLLQRREIGIAHFIIERNNKGRIRESITLRPDG